MNETLHWDNLTIVKIVAVVLEATVILCLISYCFVIYEFLKHKTFRCNLFYWLLIHLGVTDIFILTLYIFYGGPTTFNFYIVTSPILQKMLGIGVSAVSNLILIVVNLIAVNRYIAVCWFSRYKIWCSKRNLIISLIFVWFFSVIAIAIPENIFCNFTFDISWVMICDNNTIGKFIEHFISSFAMTSMLCLMITYGALFVHFRWIISKLQLNNQESEQRKREKKLLYQALIVTGVLVLYMSMFLLSNTLFELHIARMIFNASALLNSGVHPFLYLIFNSELRKYIKPNSTQTIVQVIQIKQIQNASSASDCADVSTAV